MPKPMPSTRLGLVDRDGGDPLRGAVAPRRDPLVRPREDFRTEVLGLMKAQKVKNAIIVPDGSKGFVLKRTAIGAERVKDEVATQYVTFMEGLWTSPTTWSRARSSTRPAASRTGTIPSWWPPTRGRRPCPTRRRGERALRLLAGRRVRVGARTATTTRRRTARGVWESVKRHFRELKLDPATEPFSAIGIGDMSGDVFGNGMLYSDGSGCSRRSTTGTCSSIPTRIPRRPSPSGSVFETPGSSWDDYDRRSCPRAAT